jgi:hypothetical protein
MKGGFNKLFRNVVAAATSNTEFEKVIWVIKGSGW